MVAAGRLAVPLAKTMLPRVVQSIIKNSVVGGTSALVQNTITNAFNNKSLSYNASQVTAVGAISSGFISSPIASKLVPVSPGRPSSTINFSILPATVGKKSVEQIKENTVSQLVSGVTKLLTSVVKLLLPK